jgi:hypothetical protein
MRKPGKDDELSREEMKFLHEALRIQRNDHLMRVSRHISLETNHYRP